MSECEVEDMMHFTASFCCKSRSQAPTGHRLGYKTHQNAAAKACSRLLGMAPSESLLHILHCTPSA